MYESDVLAVFVWDGAEGGNYGRLLRCDLVVSMGKFVVNWGLDPVSDDRASGG